MKHLKSNKTNIIIMQEQSILYLEKHTKENYKVKLKLKNQGVKMKTKNRLHIIFRRNLWTEKQSKQKTLIYIYYIIISIGIQHGY